MKKVTAALLIKDGLILIARRNANDRLANKWEFPGGKVEEGETPEECLRREMREEFDIEVDVGDFFTESIYHYEHGSIMLLAYFTSWKSGEISPAVHDDISWVTPEQLGNYDFAPADIPIVNKLYIEMKNKI